MLYYTQEGELIMRSLTVVVVLVAVALCAAACTTVTPKSVIYKPDNTQGDLVAQGDLTVVSKETVTITTYDVAGNVTGTQTTEKVVQSAKSQSQGKHEEKMEKNSPCRFRGCPVVSDGGYHSGGSARHRPSRIKGYGGY
jgi:hypothetical protein